MRDQERRFREIYAACYPRVLAYARRRVDDPEAAQDVVAEVFVVAWRRRSDLPEPPESLPWLLAVAHRCAANARRGATRQERLRHRLAGHDRPASGPGPADVVGAEVVGAEVVGPALDRLRPADAEILRLAVWDELDHAAIAVVLGCSVNAVGIRLHRARDRLRGALADLGHTPALTRRTTS